MQVAVQPGRRAMRNILPAAPPRDPPEMSTALGEPHRDLETQIYMGCGALGADIARALRPDISPELSRDSPLGLEPLTVNEADWLKTAGLELVRDYFDRRVVGVVLIGMPGLSASGRPLPAASLPCRLRPPLPAAGLPGHPQVLA